MPATHAARNGSIPWLLFALIGVGVLLPVGGAVGVAAFMLGQTWRDGGSQKDAARDPRMDREFWAIEQKQIERKASDEVMKEWSRHRLVHFDELFPRRGLKPEEAMLNRTKRADDEVLKGEAAFIAEHNVSADQFRTEFRHRHPLVEAVLAETPVTIRGVAERHFTQMRADAANPDVQRAAEAKPSPWQEYSVGRAEKCFADAIQAVRNLDSYKRLEAEFGK